MKKVNLLCTSFVLIAFASKSQYNTVEKIRAYYNQVNSKISTAVKTNVGEYCNEITVNKLKGSWPGVGNYQKRISIWYGADPVAEGDGKPEQLLDKINLSGESAGDKFSEEYLFSKGELLFYLYIVSYKEAGISSKDEHRVYFSRGKVLKYDLKQGSRGVSEETQHDIPVEAIRHGKIMMQLFLNSCEYTEGETL